MLQRGINAPRTSSAGRLFDGIAALVGCGPVMSYEGQAAMQLEFAMDGLEIEEHYEFSVGRDATDRVVGPLIIDWAPLVHGVLHDLEAGIANGLIAGKTHNTLVEVIVAVAQRMGEAGVVLTGGCFQNRYLTERAVSRLREAGFCPYWHQKVPPNDGGIALGQVLAAARERKRK
jgi:hydrogenase maturation protein HypF